MAPSAIARISAQDTWRRLFNSARIFPPTTIACAARGLAPQRTYFFVIGCASGDCGHDEQWLIRLWSANTYAGGSPVWIGTLTRQTSRGALRLVRYPQTELDYDDALPALKGVPGFEGRLARHGGRDRDDDGWNGRVWLLRGR
jgi:hypothetical protein